MPEEAKKSEFVIPEKSYLLELLVGVFMLLGLGCFSYIAINIAKMSFFDTGYYSVQAEFTNISGLEPGAPVEMAGVPIGSVKAFELKDTSAIITMSIRDNVPLRDDDIASIRTKGIIGDRYVRITPGASEKIVAPGGHITDTESTVDIEEIIGKIIHQMDSSKE